MEHIRQVTIIYHYNKTYHVLFKFVSIFMLFWIAYGFLEAMACDCAYGYIDEHYFKYIALIINVVYVNIGNKYI